MKAIQKNYIDEYQKLRELIALKNKYQFNLGVCDKYNDNFHKIIDGQINEQKKLLDKLIGE